MYRFKKIVFLQLFMFSFGPVPNYGAKISQKYGYQDIKCWPGSRRNKYGGGGGGGGGGVGIT